jgi:hypothetical protein
MEGIMRSRFTALTLGLYLSFALLGCNKPAAPPDSNSPSTTAPASSDNSNPSSAPGGNMANSSADNKPSSAMSNMKHEALRPMVVPAGTVITVRLGQTVGSKLSSPGETFTATVASPVVVEGKTAIATGASATGTVVDAKPLGRFKGGASLQLRLTSISIGGTEQAVSTSAVVRTATGKGKRTAVLAGGGAALGALIGGLAGGGKGAGIGALAGGGAGAGGAAFTGNKDIVLPAESALSFKLEQPVEVR